jgi:serine/threonine-protein kinase
MKMMNLQDGKAKKYLPYLIIFFSFVVGSIIFFFIADWFIMPWLIHSGSSVKVPNVIGKSYSDAEKILESNNLNFSKCSEQFNDKYPPNFVINQTPKSGLDVKSGRTIYLIVSKGQESITTPNLTGKTLREARVILIRSNMQMGDVSYVFSDSVGTDTVMHQNISAGRPMPAGSLVNVVVSKGKESSVKVPSLIGISYNEVQGILQESGLVLGSVSWGKSETYVMNTVISQNPPPGELVSTKAIINIVVAK